MDETGLWNFFEKQVSFRGGDTQVSNEQQALTAKPTWRFTYSYHDRSNDNKQVCILILEIGLVK